MIHRLTESKKVIVQLMLLDKTLCLTHFSSNQASVSLKCIRVHLFIHLDFSYIKFCSRCLTVAAYQSLDLNYQSAC